MNNGDYMKTINKFHKNNIDRWPFNYRLFCILESKPMPQKDREELLKTLLSYDPLNTLCLIDIYETGKNKYECIDVEKWLRDNFIESIPEYIKIIKEKVKEVLKLKWGKNGEEKRQKISESELVKDIWTLFLGTKNLGLDNEKIKGYLKQFRFTEMELIEIKKPINEKDYALIVKEFFSEKPTNIQWENFYLRIMLSALDLIDDNSNMMAEIEIANKETHFRTRYTDNGNTGLSIQYFEKLCDKKMYSGAKAFMERLGYFENSAIPWGLDEEEIKQKMCSINSPYIISAYKEYMEQKCKKGSEEDEGSVVYNDRHWLKDVRECNKDSKSETIKWLELDVYMNDLRIIAEKGNMDVFWRALDNAKAMEMFDIETCTYMTRLLYNQARIIEILLQHQEDCVKFFNGLDDKYLFAYKYRNILFQYRNYSKLYDVKKGEEFRAQELENILREMLFSVKESDKMLKIYMNSHLRYKVDIRDVVEQLAKNSSNDIEELFQEYPIEGKISRVNIRSTVRDKILLEPKHLYTKWTYKNVKVIEKDNNKEVEQKQEAKRNIIRSHQDWYSYNKEYAELLRIGSGCVFFIKEYLSDGYILADNITVKEVTSQMEEREKFPTIVLAWLEEVCKEQKYIPWSSKNKYSMMYVKNIGSRKNVAYALLKAIEAMRHNEGDLKVFLDNISNGMLEEINEFRYIEQQKWMDQSIADMEVNRGGVESIAKTVLNDDNLSASLKVKIYLNTCLKSLIKLEELPDSVREELLTKGKEIMLPVMCIINAGKYSFVSTYTVPVNNQERKNVFTSEYTICCQDAVDKNTLRNKWVYLVQLERIDDNEKKLYVRLGENANPDEQVKRLLYDLKKAIPKEQDNEWNEKIKSIGNIIYTKELADQFTYELINVFSHYEFGLYECNRILKLLRKINPYIDFCEVCKEMLADKKRAKLLEGCKDSYEKFINSFINIDRGLGIADICYIYANSFCKIIVSKNDFMKDMKKTGRNPDDVEDIYIKLGLKFYDIDK